MSSCEPRAPILLNWRSDLRGRLRVLRRSATVLTLLLVASACRPAAVSPAEAIRRGDELAKQEQYGQAIASYRIAVQGNPKDGETRLKLANAYLSAGQWRDAAPEAIRAADLLPNNSVAQVLAISLLLAQHRFVDAFERAVVRLQHDPDNPDLLVLSGNAKARLPNSWFALSQLEEALRVGHNYDEVLNNLRPLASPSDDILAAGAFRRALRINPKSIEAQLALANFSWAVGRPEEGEAPLEDAARLHNILANRALGQYYLRRHRHSEAESYLKVAASLGDRDAQLALADFYVRLKRDQEALQIVLPLTAGEDPTHQAALRAADIEIRLGNGEPAGRRIDHILKAAPKHLQALILKARHLLSTRRPDEAIRVGRLAVDVDAGSADARLILAQALSAKGELEEAFAQFAEHFRLNPNSTETPKDLLRLGLVLGRNEEALEYGRQAFRRNPNDETTALGLVKALLRANELSAADLTLKPLLAKHPSSPEVLVALGAIQAARGDRETARATYQRALQLDRESFDALEALVNLDLQDRNISAAKQRADHGRATHPDRPGYVLLAARVAIAAGDAPSAESGLHRVRQLDPSNLSATLLLVDLLTAQARSSEAKRLLEHWLERWPSSLDAALALAKLLETMGRPTEARARYEDIVAKNPRAPTAAARLAALYLQDGARLDLALSLASRAKYQLPNEPAVSDILGWVYVQKALPMLAIPHLEDAVRAAPANPMYRYHLGIAYHRADMASQAREELTKALRLAQTFPGAEDAQRTLQSLPRH